MKGIAVNRKTGEKKKINMSLHAIESSIYGEDEGTCPAADDCIVEPDGECPHGWPSKLISLGMI